MRIDIRLTDCCWVELEGYPRPELVIQKRLKPRIFAIDEFLYDEAGNPLAHEISAPRILVVVSAPGRRRSGR
ncbi:MAG: hypothetical protein WDN06_11685 [Asticcacaulis sp.]